MAEGPAPTPGEPAPLPVEDLDTGEPLEELAPLEARARACVSGAGVDTSDWYTLWPASRVRSLVLTLDDEAGTLVVLSYPEDGEQAYDDGAPVILVAGPPSVELIMDPPSVRFDDGMIEVQPVYPGTRAGELVAPGDHDLSGLASAEVVAQALRFATGELTAQGGHRLEDLVAQPVCRPAVLVAGSSGSMAASTALAVLAPELLDELLGASFFEAPALPIMATHDLGTVAHDGDLEVDADDDGYPWDDGRNRSVGRCSLAGCELDFADLRLGPSPVEGAPPGVYLDRNGNGWPDIDYDTEPPWPDLDQDGSVTANEDFPLGPHPVGVRGDVTWIYTPEVLTALEALDAPELEPWLGEGSTWPEEVRAAWEERNVLGRVAAWETSLPDSVQVGVTWSEVPHGVALPARPQLELLRQAAVDAGLRTWLNPSVETVACVAGEELAVHAGSASGLRELDEERLVAHAMSEELDLQELRVASALEHMVQHWGMPKLCASSLNPELSP